MPCLPVARRSFVFILLLAAPLLRAQDLAENARREIAAIIAEKKSWTPAQRKLDSRLIQAMKKDRGQAYAPGAPNLRLDVKPQADGRVIVDIHAHVTPQLLALVRQGGGQVLGSFPRFESVHALVSLKQLETLAASPDVLSIRRAARGHVNTGSVDSEGDATHLAAVARNAFGVDGTGVTVGVLSDSVDYLNNSEATGDLGPVTVLSGQNGETFNSTGEGTAMLEIVHDLAPGANLYFATAANGEAQFAQNILDLRAAGCDIIIDDFFYADESPFQDSQIAQAVNSVTESGALYFSSAGNSGNLDSGTSGTWEGDFVNGGSVSFPETGQIHRFGTVNYNTALAGSEYGVNLFWADPLGQASDDYDLYILNSSGASIVDSSTSTQDGSQDPFESVGFVNPGERIVIVKSSGNACFLRLDTGRGQLTIATPSATSGHACATNAYCVAATDVSLSYPNAFTGIPDNPVEVFSSDGPRHVFFNADGSPITPGNFSSTGGAVRQKPDITAADGVSVSVPGFTPFYGTSAAAPHAGAIAALLKSYRPTFTPSQIRSILTTTALDDMASGYDRDSGFGIVMATTALQAAQSDPLFVLPAAGLTALGNAGGPFTLAASTFMLTNTGASSIAWSVADSVSWLTLSTTNGALAPASTSSVNISVNAAAHSLAPGKYVATLLFKDQTTQVTESREVTLTVQPAIHGGYANSVLALQPVAYWRLNETNSPPPADLATNSGSRGAAANGFPFDGVAEGQTGIVQNCYRFSNPTLSVTYFGSHVDVPFQSAFNPSGAFSVEFWAKPAQTPTDLFCPVCSLDADENSGSSRDGWVFYATNTWQFKMGGNNGYTATLTGGSASANVWHHVVATFDGASARLYVDGSPVAGPTSASGFTPNTVQPLRFGATTLPNRTFDGWVDEIAIYNSVLSASVIAAHHSAASTNNGGYAAQILVANPLGYWRLDGPAYTQPSQNSLPQAVNIGTLAPNANGVFEPGCVLGATGPAGFGFGIGNAACQFNGAGFIDIPADFLNITGPLTVQAWVKASAANGQVQTVLSKGDAAYRLFLDGSGFPHFADGA